MQFAKSTRIFLSLFALLAMGWAHVVKPSRGFECDLQGVPEFSLSDHCHGQGEPESPCHEEHESHSGEETHEHTAWVESLLALASQSLVQCPAMPMQRCEWAPAPFRTLEVRPERFLDARQEERRWPRVLVHSIALRV